MKTILAIAALVTLTACVTPPTNPAELAAWNAEKTARTEARRPGDGSILPKAAAAYADASSFDDLKQEREVFNYQDPQ